MKRHLLVTNDYPPKLGGIQNYLWELWRRLPSEQVTVLTPDRLGADRFDAMQEHSIVRDRRKVFLPTRSLARDIRSLAKQVDAELVILDPALPLGHLAPALKLPYALVVHGAEVALPGRLPITKQLLRRVLRGAECVIAAGGYPASEAARAAGTPISTVEIPPGVDGSRFVPLRPRDKKQQREKLGLSCGPLVVGLSRLVPRKGFDRTIAAVAALRDEFPDIQLVIGGKGRDRRRLERIARRLDVSVRFLGRVEESEVPLIYGIADVFAMPCRNRWAGLEQEGFGIVFLEAAASGVPQVAGRSGGAHEAVLDGVTGHVVDHPRNSAAVANAIRSILKSPSLQSEMAKRGSDRVKNELSYDVLALQLEKALS
ncbi:MAG: glycosyltransferase family 4 protein [Actinomycetota bacterium]|nr:glycosyltransferase family 4 protein [Actinomycetota bacterium]MEC9057969.1 glycosyltransferase family 4 protein [Actinomycetota bacterium]MED5361922.1 glycosyltransferase family 4 protein [Actinomycetota bacterium]MEE3256303.1 glycosyltransferase family 4 protein [Actinomycetota bacterium]